MELNKETTTAIVVVPYAEYGEAYFVAYSEVDEDRNVIDSGYLKCPPNDTILFTEQVMDCKKGGDRMKVRRRSLEQDEYDSKLKDKLSEYKINTRNYAEFAESVHSLVKKKICMGGNVIMHNRNIAYANILTYCKASNMLTPNTLWYNVVDMQPTSFVTKDDLLTKDIIGWMTYLANAYLEITSE